MKKTMQAASLALSVALAAPLARAQSIERPPQYVMMAFDGSLNLAFWKESRDFAKAMKDQGKPLSFTYFMSGPYFLATANKMEYNCPHHGYGKSAIGFGGDAANLPLRVEQANKAMEEGHELGSHANCHNDAGEEKWTQADWELEFKQFYHLIFDVFAINRVQPVRPQGWLLKKEDVVGFRAPMLGVTAGLWPTLKEYGYKYDTSKTSAPNYWPEKSSLGIWNFPLAEIPIVGTGKKTLSMDYNFFYSQSKGVEDARNKELYKQQMLDSYRKYFQDNYNGNRGPINIGHHFSKWNGGAYWEAMQEFAEEVCGLPEVKCVTYSEYMNWLEQQTPAQIAAYKKGQFPKMAKPVRLTENTQVLDLSVALTRLADDSLKVAAVAPKAQTLSGVVSRISVNGEMLDSGSVDLNEIREQLPEGETVEISAHLFSRDGIELARSTQRLKNLGLENEQLDKDVLETRALKGDLPEAHLGEEDVVPDNLD